MKFYLIARYEITEGKLTHLCTILEPMRYVCSLNVVMVFYKVLSIVLKFYHYFLYKFMKDNI